MSSHKWMENDYPGERSLLIDLDGVSPFLAWGDFHALSRFARSTIPEEKWGTTRSLHWLGRWPKHKLSKRQSP